jgi:hypothetical protein
MKWFKGLLSAMFLASMIVVPSGCGGGKATDIDTEGMQEEHAPGHEEMAENINKKPDDVGGGPPAEKK